MGLLLSSQKSQAIEPEKSSETKVEDVKTDETQISTSEEVIKTSEPENVLETKKETSVSDVVQPIPTAVLTSVSEGNTVGIVERYVEQPGTKVEVVPVDTSERVDVVKKPKKKNKSKKNKD